MGYFSKQYAAVDPQGNRLDPEVWSDDIFVNSLQTGDLSGQTGPVGSGAAIQIDERLTAEPGSQINYTYVPYTKTKMILGNETSIEKNAAELKEYGLPIKIHIVSASFRRKGKLTQQRMVWNFRMMARNHLKMRNRDYQQDINIATMAGVSYTELESDEESYKSVTDTVDRVEGDTRCFRAVGTNSAAVVTSADSDNVALAAAVGTGDKASTELIESILLTAKENDPYKVTPIMLENGEEVYCMVFSLKAARDLKKDPFYEKYNVAQVTAGGSNDNFAKSSFGQWENVLLKSSDRIIEFGPVGNRRARNLFFGGDAVINIFGNLQADFTEEVSDHKVNYSAATSTVRGESKAIWNGTEVNVIQAITASNK